MCCFSCVPVLQSKPAAMALSCSALSGSAAFAVSGIECITPRQALMISQTPLLPSLIRTSRCERGKHMRMGELVTVHVSTMRTAADDAIACLSPAGAGPRGRPRRWPMPGQSGWELREGLNARIAGAFTTVAFRSTFSSRASRTLATRRSADGVLRKFLLRPQGARGQRPPRAIQVPVPGNLHM